MLTLRADGTWLHGLAPIGDLGFQTVHSRTGGGLQVVSWSMALQPGFTHPCLRRGALVELYAGPLRLGAAVLAEPNRDEWTFTADGVFRSGERFVAVDATGAPSTDISVIVPAAIDRGMSWRDPGDLPIGAVSTDSEDAANLNFVTDVLNRYCQVNGLRWWVDEHDYLRIGSDPATPTLALTPGVPAIATADDDYRSALFGRYVSAVSGSPAEPSAWGAVSVTDAPAAGRWGAQEAKEDLTDLGLLTGPDATALLQARLDADKARPAYSQAVEAALFQVTTLGGVPPEPWQVRARQMVRHFGWLDSDGNLAWGQTVDWVIGSATYRAGEQTVTLGPMDLAPRTTAQVVAAQEAAIRDGFS